MAKAATYLKDIRAQVRADHGGKVPDHLNLTIRNYANALEIRTSLSCLQVCTHLSLIYAVLSLTHLRKTHPDKQLK